MIKIADKPLDPQTQENEYSNNSLEWSIIETMSNSPEIYDYDSLNQFKFEVEMRNATVNAAKELGSVKFDFATFRHSKCNSAYWDRTDDGGFLLKSGVKPSVAIRDIFENAYEYATECRRTATRKNRHGIGGHRSHVPQRLRPPTHHRRRHRGLRAPASGRPLRFHQAGLRNDRALRGEDPSFRRRRGHRDCPF